MKQYRSIYSLLLLCLLSFASCIKKDFDAPPDQRGYDPKLTVTTTIADLTAMDVRKEITEDLVISGIVVADDRSGNLYKQVIIEDSTGGIALLLDANSLYNNYPVGRKVYVKLKGLYLENYNDIPQLGYTPDNTGGISNIPSALLDKYVIKANYPNPVIPKVVTLKDIAYTDYRLINRLVTIEGVEFDSLNIYKKYADPAPVSGTSRTVVDCEHNTIILRTSGYANFQPYLTPAGHGSITGIYTSYKGTPQLVIRDTSDVRFYGMRCNNMPPPPPPPPPTFTALSEIRNMWKGTEQTLGNYTIKGVVISDKGGNNTTSGRLMTLQDGDAGITFFFSTTHSFAAGDSLTINISGATLSIFNGLLQITNLSAANAEKAGTGKITPKTATIAEIVSNLGKYEATLVRIANATISGSGGTYVGSKTLNDGSGTPMVVYTYNSATFANTALPTTPKTFTGILSVYNSTPQLIIRNINDVQ